LRRPAARIIQFVLEIADCDLKPTAMVRRVWQSRSPRYGTRVTGDPKSADPRGSGGVWTLLDRSLLRALAGTRSYDRGVDYFESGCVERLEFEGEALLATVQGTQRYRVELWPGEGAIEHSCSCPQGRDGAFCKHCVAAGLALLAVGGEALKSQPQPLSLDAIGARLESMDREALQSLLLEQARTDERVLERLRLRLAADSDELDLASFRRAIELAVDPGDFISYHEAYEWSRGVDEVIDAIERLLEGGHAEAVIELSEHALAALARVAIDDSSGHLAILCERLEQLHLAASERARPDPAELAERMLRWQLDCDLEVFFDAADTYRDVLGETGLERYAELARAEWERVPALGPGDERDYGSRFRITHVMENLAEASGDLDALVAVLRRDLSSPYCFLRIAEAYHRADRSDEAIAWAERGLEAFVGERADSRIQEFLAELYAERGRHADALEMTWERFADHPRLESYRELKPYAERLEEWPRRRERALGLLRKRAREAREEAQRRGHRWLHGGDHSQLVRILLWEGDLDAAWREAEAGGCDESLWLELAGRRKDAHPEDALRVYRERIEPTIARKTKRDYEDALGLIEQVGELLRRLGREHELSALVAEIRAAHARKRNLIALLDCSGLDAAGAPARSR
jgi:uncharacterized Zn finger protein